MPGVRKQASIQLTLTELNRHFLPPLEEPAESTYFRGVLLAVAQDMLVRLPDKPGRDAAIESLAVAVCEPPRLD